MAQQPTWSSGQVLAQAEGSIGTAVRAAVANYYKGHDLDTAQTIRRAQTDTEAGQLVTAIRQGRVTEVAMVAVSAALGVLGGALAQKAVNNAAIKGVPVVTPLGVVPAVAGAGIQEPPCRNSGIRTLVRPHCLESKDSGPTDRVARPSVPGRGPPDNSQVMGRCSQPPRPSA